jgi:hypothetical protein
MLKRIKPPKKADLSHISPDLRPLATTIKSVILDPNNARLHPEKNLRGIVASMRRYGQRKNVVVNARTGHIEAGNGTLLAALELGWEYVAASFEDDDHATAQGFALTDNRTAELAKWDYEALSRQMVEQRDFGVDLEDLGWEPHEYEPLVAANWEPPRVDAPRNQPGHVVSFTAEQWEIVEATIESVKKSSQLSKPAEILTAVCKHWTEQGKG